MSCSCSYIIMDSETLKGMCLATLDWIHKDREARYAKSAQKILNRRNKWLKLFFLKEDQDLQLEINALKANLWDITYLAWHDGEHVAKRLLKATNYAKYVRVSTIDLRYLTGEP